MTREAGAPALRRTVLTACLVVVATALAVTFAGRARSWDPSCFAGRYCDALTFRVVGSLLARGQSPYDPVARRTELSVGYLHGAQPPANVPFQYPPYALPLFAAANLLWHSDIGELIWAGLTAALFVIAAAGLLGAVSRRGGEPMLIALALSGVLFFNASLGQTGALTSALLIGAAWLWTDRPVFAGLLLGLAMLKPQYAIPGFVVAACRRDWRVLLGGVGACAALSAISLVLYGPEVWRAYPSVLKDANETLPFMVGWSGILAQSTGVVIQPRVTIAVYGLTVAMLAAVGIRLARSTRPPDARLLFACALAWALVVSPNTHAYDVTLLAPALIALAVGRRALVWAAIWMLASWIGVEPVNHWILCFVTIAAALVLTRQIRMSSLSAATSPSTTL